MNYTKAFKIIRASKELSQKDFSDLLGVDASYISLVESGQRVPSTKLLGTISAKLNIPLYLISLLASDKDDLKGIGEKDAEFVGKELLNVLISS